MSTSRRSLLKQSAAAAAAVGLGPRLAHAADETVRIGVIYDLSGPLAGGGSVACSIGCQIAIDLVNEKGGIAGKYKVVPINADSQSKVDVAINEVERLLGQEKVEIINGVYASAHAVPLSAKVEAQKKILWITTAIATAKAAASPTRSRPRPSRPFPLSAPEISTWLISRGTDSEAAGAAAEPAAPPRARPRSPGSAACR